LSNRNGFGILLVFVGVILLIIFATGAGQSFFSSQVISHTHRAGIGNNCRYLAECVCTEAFFRIENNVNDSSKELYSQFREKVFGRGPASFDITVGSLKESEALLVSLPKAHEFSIDSVTARVEFRRPISSLSYEVLGTIRVCALVSSAFYPNLQRKTEILRDFKMALVSSPRPFCKASVFIGSSEGFLDDTDPNHDIKRSYSNIRLVWTQFNETIDKFREEGGEAESAIPDLEAALSEIEAAAGDMLVGTDGASAKSPYDWEKLPEPPVGKVAPHYYGDANVEGIPLIVSPFELMILTDASELDLAEIDLQKVVVPLNKFRKEALDKYEEKIQYYKDNNPSTESELRDMYGELKDLGLVLVNAAVAVLKAHYDFQSLLSEKSGDSYDVWNKFVIGKLRLPEWKAKAFYTVSTIDELENLIMTSGGTLSGIVYLDSSSPVTISNLNFQGKLILVVPSDLSLDTVGVVDETLDLLTIVSFGGVRLDGSIKATVVMGYTGDGPRDFECGSSTILTGSLIAAEGIKFMEGKLQGVVKYNKLINSGDTGVDEKNNHYFVAISPQIRAKNVKRN
jgi:hypothetical protein